MESDYDAPTQRRNQAGIHVTKIPGAVFLFGLPHSSLNSNSTLGEQAEAVQGV